MPHRLVRILKALVRAAAVIATVGVPAAALAEVPVCTGRDVLQELRRDRPEIALRIDAAARETPNAGALLWRVEKAGVAPSHLFGTVHLSDDRVLTLPTAVRSAVDGADRVVLEIGDLSPRALELALGRNRELLVARGGRSLAQALQPSELDRAQRAMEQVGVPGEALAQLRPWVVTMLMALSPCERRRMTAGRVALDNAIAQRGRSRGRPVVGLETLDDQLKAMASVGEEHQLVMLRASLALYDRTDDLMETLVLRYLERQIGHIWPLQKELWLQAGFGPEALDSFQEALLTRRNKRMEEAAIPLLRQGRSFIAVGALHLVGRDGLVQLLRDAGWTVTAVN
jgi:uncharacterized protein